MSSSYVSNHVHIVFSTKERLRSISEKLQPKLWAYMAGILKNHRMHAVAVGGMEGSTSPISVSTTRNVTLRLNWRCF